MYSLTYGAMNNEEKHKATGKGIKRSHLKANIKHADYKRCIQSVDPKDQRPAVKWPVLELICGAWPDLP